MKTRETRPVTVRMPVDLYDDLRLAALALTAGDLSALLLEVLSAQRLALLDRAVTANATLTEATAQRRQALRLGRVA